MNKVWSSLAFGMLIVFPASGRAEEKPAAAPPVAAAPAAVVADSAPCCGGDSCGCHGQHVRDWLCYRKARTPCGACKVCPSCCVPPLYAFFLASGGGPGVERLPRPFDECEGCGGGHRLQSLWQRFRAWHCYQ